MAQPYIGEIRIFAGNFAPLDWAFCNGQLLAISQNPTLFNLIGTTYGGDGVNTYALPDLQSRVPMHMGQGSGLNNYLLGQIAGADNCATGTGVTSPTGFSVERNLAVTINSTVSVETQGSNANRLGMSFIIALFGIFPSQN